MSLLFIVNWFIALIGIVHVMCNLSHLGHLPLKEWRGMRWRRRVWELAWRVGYAALGAGCAGILLGPVYGYIHPPGWEVVVNVGWLLALLANYLRSHEKEGENA